MSPVGVQPTTALQSMVAAEQAARAYPKRRRRKALSGWSIAGWVYMVLLLIFTVLPMVWMLSTSLKSEFASIQQPPVWIPKHPSLAEYRQLLNPNDRLGAQFLRYMWNSVWVSTMTTVIGLFVAVPAAYAFSRFSFPGRSQLFFSVLVRNMFPTVVFLIPLFILMKNLRLIDNQWSLILTYLTFGLPLSIWLLKGFFDN
ncbi:MAG TPA: carbohydrate ABC transporter permease, partial [Thermomicrobiales bacterium]|nr:carbohydrate ABC transporter permease [Thermomicrobiales bacterium]